MITALILAGGQSSRMGQDKALLMWQGQPLLQRICEVASVCCQDIYILTPWPQRYQHLLKASNWQLLPEQTRGQGPLQAFAEGLLHLSSTSISSTSIDPPDWILLLACDLPDLNPQILQEWSQDLSYLPNHHLAFVPKHSDYWDPLCGFYRPQVLADLQLFIQNGGRSFQDWLCQIPVKPIAVTAEIKSMVRNCNTPQDF